MATTRKLKPEEDGVTHINVYSKGKTELGRWLSNFAYSPIDIPEHGHFNSIEGYWYWLSTGDEELRRLHGFAAKKRGREMRGEDWPAEPGFMEFIKAALRIKIKSKPEMGLVLHQNELPLVHYYVFGDKVHDMTPESEWILGVFNEKES